MCPKKALSLILVISTLLLVTGVVVTHAGIPIRQVEVRGDPGLVAASSGVPIGGPFLIADQPVDTFNPAVAYNNQHQEYMVVWWNNRTGCDDIYGQRVGDDGALIGSWFSVSAGCPDERKTPDVAYNTQQDEYLVVWWADEKHIRGQLLSATGQPQGGVMDIAVGSGTMAYDKVVVAYASVEDKYLVVYGYSISSVPAEYGIIAQAFNSDGSAWGSSFEIASITWSFRWPDLTYNRLRNEFLVVWEHYPGSQSDIVARRVKMSGGAGVLGDTFVVSFDTSQNDVNPVVAALPRAPDGQYLVAWEYGGGYDDIYAQFVSGQGNLEGAPLQVAVSPSDSEDYPSVAGNENAASYLITYQQTDYTTYYNAEGRSVSVGGDMGPEFLIDEGFAMDTSTSSGPHGDFLVTYINQSATTSYDVWGRLVGNRVYLPMVVK
jgi:hypothetical protein